MDSKRAAHVFRDIRDQSSFWEPLTQDGRSHAMVGMGTQIDLAAGGVLELLLDNPLITRELTFMDKAVFFIMVIMMAQQVEEDVSLTPNACKAVIAALQSASSSLEGDLHSHDFLSSWSYC